MHYGANGDSVAGQKDTEEMHMRTRELLSWIDRVRPIVTLSPDPENRVHGRAIQARSLGKRIGRVAFECVNLVWDLLRASGKPLKGNYLGSDIPMSDGFAANAQFFKLSFLDKKAVAMDMQFKELLTTLWMKAGAVGECPVIENGEIDDYYIFPENKMAILKEEDAYRAFKKAMKEHDDITTVFIITDSDSDFREMSAEFSGKKCYQLYRDYLDNFSINYERN